MKQLSEEYAETVSSFDEAAPQRAVADAVPPLPEDNDPPEVREARGLARRYRLPYVDLLPPDGDSPIDYELRKRSA